MSRYTNFKTNTRFDGKQVYPTRLLPRVPISANDLYVITQEGDRLDVMANTFYKNTSYWWIIASANGINGIYVKPGIQIRIPQNIVGVLAQFENQ